METSHILSPLEKTLYILFAAFQLHLFLSNSLSNHENAALTAGLKIGDQIKIGIIE